MAEHADPAGELTPVRKTDSSTSRTTPQSALQTT